MKKIFLSVMFLFYFLLVSNAHSIEHVIGFSGGYKYYNMYSHNSLYQLDNKDVFINNPSINSNILNFYASFEYQIRSYYGYAFGITNSHSFGNLLNFYHYNNFSLKNRNMETSFLFLFPFYTNPYFALRGGFNIGYGTTYLQYFRNTIILPSEIQRIKKEYIFGNLVMFDAEFRIFNHVILFSRANLKVGEPSFNNLINEGGRLSIMEDLKVSTSINFGIRYKLL